MKPISHQKYFLMVTVVLAVFIAACSSRVPSDWQTYQSSPMSLTVQHPSQWELKESTVTFAFVFKDPATQHTGMIGFGHLQDPFIKDLLCSEKVFPKQSVHGTVQEIVQLNGVKA